MNRLPLPRRPTPLAELTELLAARGIRAASVGAVRELDELRAGPLPQLVLVDAGAMAEVDVNRCGERFASLRVPTLALFPRERLAGIGALLAVDDLVVTPCDESELVARARRALARSDRAASPETVKVGELVITPSTYEVTVRGRRVGLRFKEYELLRLLASSPGRVYTREVLLSRIWGYDYFGGTRTVDVHVRRLRSKIEDADHQFIETIWNVGYRLKDVAEPA